MQLAYKAILAAVEDAGLSISEVDGFSYYADGFDTALLGQILGIPEIRFSAMITGGGGGSAGAVGLASAAVHSRMAETVVCVMALQQSNRRLGAAYARKQSDKDTDDPGVYGPPSTSDMDFILPSGLMGPVQMFALLTTRHFQEYGTTREHLAEVAISTRNNAIRRPGAMMRSELTVEQYLAGRMISDPLCVYDCCLESDGAVAVVVTSSERARDLRHPPAYISGAAHGGAGRWGKAVTWFGMPEEYFVSSGHRPVAQRVYEMASMTASDIDVALLYDHFTPMVLMQLEDYGFCGIGQSGPFVAEGNIRWPNGSLPVNTHGGNLSEGYIVGMTHIKEAVEQLRGTAVNQVTNAEVALVTGGPASLPVSSLILRR
jgi:acetyl-CoA acetyltransferase